MGRWHTWYKLGTGTSVLGALTYPDYSSHFQIPRGSFQTSQWIFFSGIPEVAWVRELMGDCGSFDEGCSISYFSVGGFDG